jgi:hypothetical protein
MTALVLVLTITSFTPPPLPPQRLAKYQMLTLEKWYTPCASQGPTQSGPECDVEKKMLDLYARTKAINPQQIR